MRIVTDRGNIVPLLGDFEPDIRDIAIALARIPRFTGHSDISVAQHSVLVSRLVPQYGIFPKQGLLHDAHECYCGDMSSPMKEAMAVVAQQNHAPDIWRIIEDQIAERVRRFFGIPTVMGEQVHKADGLAARLEIGHFDLPAKKAFTALGWSASYEQPINFEDHEKPNRVWDRDEARRRFLARFKMLYPEYQGRLA